MLGIYSQFEQNGPQKTSVSGDWKHSQTICLFPWEDIATGQ